MSFEGFEDVRYGFLDETLSAGVRPARQHLDQGGIRGRALDR